MKQQLEDVTKIKAAVTEFYQALNAMFTGDATPMVAIWSHADDVTCLGPQGGILVGWKQILLSWNELAALRLGGEIEPQDIHIVQGTDLAIVQNDEVGINTLHGKTVKVKIRATNIFRNEDGRWKMISHHTDPLPYL